MSDSAHKKVILLFIVNITQIPMINRNKTEITLVDVRTSGIYIVWVRGKVLTFSGFFVCSFLLANN